MSFITKRERVFNEYDLFDLPARNEGKLKAYASCTDARAWSHFCSDKSEHLVEIIKRNNEVCRTKYIPTDVIVSTLMATKNAEISRLKHKIEEFEQMIAAYDQLDLTCDQKCEIQNAHAAIRAANKELDDLFLNLDLSNFTEGGIDSEGFQTGKSRGDEPGKGDEWTTRKADTDTKGNQANLSSPRDATTNATDPRIDDMQDALITKDAKLSAMQNTIAVMENDVCEPYCIYAHIYTALEKIFGILMQNDKYKLYLNLLTSGKDTRCIDIKGRILYKLKVLEKFSQALVAPCSQELSQPQHEDNCTCYHAEVITHVETTFALSSAECKLPIPSLDTKRAQLVADIMENDEMKEILSKESIAQKSKQDDQFDDGFCIEDYNIDTENLNRLKSLQVNYDELMSCYENMKHERDCLQVKCQKYDELEAEFLKLQSQLIEYNGLWNEKEHYRRRSEDLDNLKEQYLVLAEETTNLETQLKAEAEINDIKTTTIEDLRSQNIILEKKLNDATIAFEREKIALQCKLKEYECKVMCQDQQIRSLSAQIDRLLEQDRDKSPRDNDASRSIDLIDEIEALRDQIRNLKETICVSEDEKLQLRDQFHDKLKIINDLKMEIEDWKTTYETTLNRNDCLEKCSENFRSQLQNLIEENTNLSHDLEEKNTAVANLINVIHNKSQELNHLMNQVEEKRKENRDLSKQLREIRQSFDSNSKALENEKKQTQLVKQESRELLEKMKDYEAVVNRNDTLSRSLEAKGEDCEELKEMLKNTIEENKRLQFDVDSHESNNSILLLEIQRLREVNKYALDNINNLQGEKNQYQSSLELTKKESEILETKVIQFENLRDQLHKLRDSHEKLIAEKNRLESELNNKTNHLDNVIHSLELTKRESEEILDKLKQSEDLRGDMVQLTGVYHKLINEKQTLQKELADKNKELDNLLQTLQSIKKQNEDLLATSHQVITLENELAESKRLYDELLREKNQLQNDFDNKTGEINHLYNTLENKIEENRDLLKQMKALELSEKAVINNMTALKDEHLNTRTAMDAIRKESIVLMNKLKNYETLTSEFDKLKRIHDEMLQEKERLQQKLDSELADLRRIKKENDELNNQNQNLLAHNEDLDRALISARNELIAQPLSQNPYADVMKEIEAMKNEKLMNHKKIRELLDRVEESEHVINNLGEEVMARDDKIAVLQNHINSLEDEVRRLHHSLQEVLGTGEELKDNYHQIDQSLNILEAHHSKAAHNMKMELAKLQNENVKLEQQLSVTKMKSDESFRDKHKYASQVIHLQNEREIIITDIKQLELDSVGDSVLLPHNCNTEDVLTSLDRIRAYLYAKTSKSTSLEQTILKVQTSSQLLLTKADEAKRLVEKEKQKIINEKEEAIAARLAMEKQLSDLKEKLEIQTNDDKAIIEDLEAKILNQKLIVDQINKSTQDYIAKLEKEMQNLKDLYQNSLTKIKEQKEKINILSNDKDKNTEILDRIKRDLEQKSKEVSTLQNKLAAIKSKPQKDFDLQVCLPDDLQNMSSQTDRAITEYGGYKNPQSEISSSNIKLKDDVHSASMTDIGYLKVKKTHKDEINTELLPKNKPASVNQVQVLTANVQPTFDFVKNSYLDYKIKRLSTGRLEQYSITGYDNDTKLDTRQPEPPESQICYEASNKTYAGTTSPNSNLVDIYNRQSLHTISSKVEKSDQSPIIYSKNVKSATKTSDTTGNNVFEYDSPADVSKYDNSNVFIESSSGKSTDKDLFIIYRDSESCHDTKKWKQNAQPPILIETMTVQSTKQENKYGGERSKPHKQNKYKIDDDDDELYHQAEDKLIKPTLNIEMPKVVLDTFSNNLTDECEDDESYIMKMLGTSSTKKTESKKEKDKHSPREAQYLDTENIKTNIKAGRNVIKRDLESSQNPNVKSLRTYSRDVEKDKQISHHKLSRVGADVLIFKNKNDNQQLDQKDSQFEEPGKFGLEYILNAVQNEFDPDFTYNTFQGLRKSQSDEAFRRSKYPGVSESGPSKLPALDYKPSYTLSSKKSQTEQSILVKIDSVDEHEKKIQYLTTALQNIEKDYKKKIEAIKVQYDNNIRNIINEHNQGVRSIQFLHEETLQDIIKIHENEVENLRSMSIDAMRKAEKLEKENQSLKSKIQECCGCINDEPVRISTSQIRKRRPKSRGDMKMLTKTNVEAFNVKPKVRSHGPCTCSLDINISDTIRNIFEQVDVEQRKLAEHAYLKYIANKILSGNVEALDSQELSFLHLKVCRTWKQKLNKEEALQKRIDTLESELINKQRHAQEHIAELDRKVAEERRRLQEVREAVCRNSPTQSPRPASPSSRSGRSSRSISRSPPRAPPPTAAEKDFACNCGSRTLVEVGDRRSAGDLLPGVTIAGPRPRRNQGESSRKPASLLRKNKKVFMLKMDIEERHEKKLFDEPPTRLRRTYDRHGRPNKK